jgi:hypothetical protein
MKAPDANQVLQEHGADAVRKRLDQAKPYNGQAEQPKTEDGVTIESFRAYMQMHNYIFIPTGELWP